MNIPSPFRIISLLLLSCIHAIIATTNQSSLQQMSPDIVSLFVACDQADLQSLGAIIDTKQAEYKYNSQKFTEFLNTPDNNKRTLLHILVIHYFLHTDLETKQNYITMLHVLINYSMNVNAQDMAGNTPLHYIQNDTEHDGYFLIRTFIKHGANPFLSNKKNRTVFDKAEHKELKNFIALYRNKEKVFTQSKL